jgi:hypothetical protein
MRADPIIEGGQPVANLLPQMAQADKQIFTFERLLESHL